MEWTNLPTNYKDAAWSGLRKYVQSDNDDGTVSFNDVTSYTEKENSFFGAKDANTMNAAMNELAGNMDSVEQNAAVATQKATDAASSASSAASSKTAAANSATQAASSASAAATSANSASGYATNAANSASSAASSANSASGYATNAANSASAASGYASSIQASATLLSDLSYSNAGAHNAIYRGKYLGSSVTSDQYAAIIAGTFEDLYIGDYWTIGGVNWRIAAFDHYPFVYTSISGNLARRKFHHVVIVPDTALYKYVMNDTADATGGYQSSKMFKQGLTEAEKMVGDIFGSHVVYHKVTLVMYVTDGHPTSFYDAKIKLCLLSEQMRFGMNLMAATGTRGNTSGLPIYLAGQLPLFRYDNWRYATGTWLRDVASQSSFVSDGGITEDDSRDLIGCPVVYSANTSLGVRPYFCIATDLHY